MKSAKTPLVRKSAHNTPNNQSGFTTRKNTQITQNGIQREDIVSPQKTHNQNQSQQVVQQSQSDLNQSNQQWMKGNPIATTNSRVEYSQNINNTNQNYSQNGRTLDYPNSQSNLDEHTNSMQQHQYSSFQQSQQQSNSQNLIGQQYSNKKILKSIRSEAKLLEVTSGNIQNIDFNYSIVDNLIAKRGFAQEKMVPMELFQETMQYFERRLSGIEQRMEDNEQLVHLSDRLLELRNPNSVSKDSYIYSQQNQSMSPTTAMTYATSAWARGSASNADIITSTFGSAQTQKNTQLAYAGGNSAPHRQTDSRVEVRGFGNDSNVNNTNNNNNNNNNNNFIELQSKMQIVEKKIAQFDDFTKNLMQDIEKKFGEYSKKLNAQIEKFFKNASQKMEQYGEKDQKLETIHQQLEILNQTYVLKQEELIIHNEELNDSIKTISALISKLENRLNEHSIDLQENRTLITGIEDDLFIMLQNYKELSEGVQSYRNLYDEISYLKQNQANILKNINISAIHCLKN